MKSFKNYLATTALISMVFAPNIGLAYDNQALVSLYQRLVELLQAELKMLQSPPPTAVSFDAIGSSLVSGSLVDISFRRLPAGNSSLVNFSLETGSGAVVGALANGVTANGFSWQVTSNFKSGLAYDVLARDADGNPLGRSGSFSISSSTSPVPTSAPSVSQSNTPSPVAGHVPTAAEVASADINLGSIGLWSFDKYSNSCDTKGGAVTDAPGRFGSALGLNGADAYCQVSNNKIFYPKNFTLALWAKSDSGHVDSWNDSNWFVSLRDQSGFVIGPLKNSKSVKFDILDDTNLMQNYYSVGTVTPSSITDWHHYAMTYDGSVAKVYFDGVLVNSTTTAISRSYAGIKDLYFGLDTDSSGQHFGDGTLDEIRLYNRPLTNCEIQILAGKGCGGLTLSSFDSRANLASVLFGIR